MNFNTPNGGRRKTNFKRRWPRIALMTAAVCFVLGVLLAGGIAWWAYREYQPPSTPYATVLPGAQGGTSPSTVHRAPVRVMVNHGESVTEIARQLMEAGLIRNPLIFRVYVRYVHASYGLKAGAYDIQPGTEISAIVRKFRDGDVVSDAVAVTIPEGFTVTEIGHRLAALHICSSAAFIYQVQHGDFSEPFTASLKPNKRTKYRLEGYLFPDTYQFERGESPHTVVDMMLQDFQQHIDAAHIVRSVHETGQSLSTVITKASMIEKEAKVKSDMPLISSVIDNRLKQGMKLQIDATIQYILGHRDIVTEKDLQVKDPYNTYLHMGLPPGPIASPGMATIEAALHPAHTKYLYYVAKYDGTGTSYFSSTESQHLQNVKKSEANFRRQGTSTHS